MREATRRKFLTRGLSRIVGKPDMTYVLPPSDLAAEQRLLGACLNHPDLRKWALSYVRPDQFADPVHANIMAALRDGTSPRQVDSLNEVGGPQYIASLADWSRELAEVYLSYITRDMAAIITTHGMREADD